MGVITTIVVCIGSFFAAALAKLLADEFKAWRPSLVSYIIRIAASRLPAEESERYHEEWSAHVEEIPGDLSKVAVACGFLKAGISMANPNLVGKTLKRSFDVILSVSGLVGFLPAFAIIAVLIVCDSRGPVFFRMKRWGKGGKMIYIYKFRSMRIDVFDESSATKTTAHNPQVTRIGAFLRKNNFDELPQLINILRGDMSFLGPRSQITSILTDGKNYDELEDAYRLRLSVRPGLIGPAEIVSEYDKTDFARNPRNELQRRVDLEKHYIENISFRRDISLIAKMMFGTIRGIWAIVRRRNSR